ncbi:MAG: hypothetical protein AAGB93_05080 [Planctomycetota bacterium]
MTRNARSPQVAVSSLFEGTMSRQVAAVSLGRPLSVYVQRLAGDVSAGNLLPGASEGALLSTDRIAVSADWSAVALSRARRGGGLEITTQTGIGAAATAFDRPTGADLQIARDGSALLEVDATGAGAGGYGSSEFFRISLLSATGEQVGATQTVSGFWFATLSPRGDAFVVGTSEALLLFRRRPGARLERTVLARARQAWFSDTGSDLFVVSGERLAVLSVGNPARPLAPLPTPVDPAPVLDHATLADGREAVVQRTLLTAHPRPQDTAVPWVARPPQEFEFRSVAVDEGDDLAVGVVRRAGSPYLGPGAPPDGQPTAEFKVLRYPAAAGVVAPARTIDVGTAPWWNGVAPVVRRDDRSTPPLRSGFVVWAWPSAWRIEL